MFRVLHISTDDITGGAARCAYRLHRGLRDAGCDSRMLVARRRSDDPSVIGFLPSRNPIDRARTLMRNRGIRRSLSAYQQTRPAGVERFSDDRTRHGPQLARRLPDCDALNLHWIANLVDVRTFFALAPPAIPLVWTLHDMNAFTGGCHYDSGCGRFEDQCGVCPQLGSTRPMDLSWQIWRRKQATFARLDPERLHIVTPSRWLAHEVERSSILGDRFPVSVIPYGIDTDAFAPRDTMAARDALGIPLNANVVLFIAESTENHRKGFAALGPTLARLEGRPDLFLLSVGKGTSTMAGPIPHKHLQYVNDDRLLSMIYSAADVLVFPSLQDNLPAVVLEALACGLPIAAFDVGGVPDAVRPGQTGALVRAGDTDALAAAIGSTLDNRERLRELKANCRRIAIHEYALAVQARRYLELYASLT
ncbi:MAG: glycosyltransferase family 4 protein, partial [Longimicrobiales bacterium]